LAAAEQPAEDRRALLIYCSRTLDSVQGNARLAEASVAEEAAAALDSSEKDVAIGGAGLAAAAIELGLVDELRMFRSGRGRWAARPSYRRSPRTSHWT
jgi:dihydrofolate reductase